MKTVKLYGTKRETALNLAQFIEAEFSKRRRFSVSRRFWFPWTFKLHRPVTVSYSDGYGGSVSFEEDGDTIAYISGNQIELFYPEWYADIEDVIRKFEAKSGEEVTLRYWQSAKDNPA